MAGERACMRVMRACQALSAPKSSVRTARNCLIPTLERRSWQCPASKQSALGPASRHSRSPACVTRSVQAAAAAGEEEMIERPPHDPESPVVVLAGFYVEELATVRQLLDEVGGPNVRVIPTTPALLYAPGYEALTAREIDWDQPVPSDWQDGGGWGKQRMALIAGIEDDGIPILLELMEANGIPDVVPVVPSPETVGLPLGEVLARGLQQHRAAKPAAKPEAELPLKFVEQLPPVEEVVAEEVWQPEGSNGQEAATTNPADHEVVQAEFTESAQQVQPQQGVSAAAADARDADVPLDIIDRLATASAGQSVEEMDSEELLSAARQALGLDSAELQRMVDDAAAKAAAALDVPFVPLSDVTADVSSPVAAPPGVPHTTSGSKMPWDAPQAPTQQPSSRQQPAPRGFGPTRPLKRGARKASSKVAVKPGSSTPAHQAAAVPAAEPPVQRQAQVKRAAPQPTFAAAAPVQPPGDLVPDTDAPISSDSRGGKADASAEEKKPEGHTFPPMEQFVLSKSQLKAVTEKHGLDYEELLQGLRDRGIQLSE